LIVSNIGQALLDERQWGIPWKNQKMLQVGAENSLETNNNANGISHHLHCNLLHRSWQSSAEYGLLDIGMGTSCHDFLRLRQEFGIQETISLVQYQMANTGQGYITRYCKAFRDDLLFQIKSTCL